jgi:hypothetical protein
VYGNYEDGSSDAFLILVLKPTHFWCSSSIHMQRAICTAKCKSFTISLLDRNPATGNNGTIEWYMDFLKKVACSQIPYHNQPIVV